MITLCANYVQVSLRASRLRLAQGNCFICIETNQYVRPISFILVTANATPPSSTKGTAQVQPDEVQKRHGMITP
jgi:hypothetical protein